MILAQRASIALAAQDVDVLRGPGVAAIPSA
jgi:hypothetical protein